MSISTYDQLVAAMANAVSPTFIKASGTAEAAGVYYDYFLNAGSPGAGAAPSVGLAGQQVDASFAGVFPYTNAQAGKQKYLAGLSLANSAAGVLSLYDRLWQNSGIVVTTTTVQSWTPVALPARDENGQNFGANVDLWLEVYTATTNGAAVTTATVSYTNSSGVAGRTGTIASIPATAVAGTMVPVLLQSGDTGVRSVESITLGTSLVTGAVGLVLTRRLADIPVVAANTGDSRNFFDIARRLFDGSAMVLMTLPATTTAGQVAGTLALAEG